MIVPVEKLQEQFEVHGEVRACHVMQEQCEVQGELELAVGPRLNHGALHWFYLWVHEMIRQNVFG